MTRMTHAVTVEGGRLLFEGVDVAGLAGRVDTPFFLYSQARIAANVARLRRAFAARHAASRVFFAGKACSNLWFLEQVRAAGAGIEVNSGGELWKALRAGFSPDQAVFNGVAKSRRELEEAVAAGIRGTVADSLCELRRLEEVARDLGRPARVLPRVDVNVAGGTHPGLETASGGKAGIDMAEATRGVPPRGCLGAPRAGRPAPAHRLADHGGRSVPARARRGARPARRRRARARGHGAGARPGRRLRRRLPRARPAARRRLLLHRPRRGRLRRRDLRRGGAAAPGARALGRAGPLDRRRHGDPRHARGEREDQASARPAAAGRWPRTAGCWSTPATTRSSTRCCTAGTTRWSP